MKKIFLLYITMIFLLLSCGYNIIKSANNSNAINDDFILNNDRAIEQSIYSSNDLKLKLAWARSEVINDKGVLFGIARLEIGNDQKVVIHYSNDGTCNLINSFLAKDHGLTEDKKFKKFYFYIPEDQQIVADDKHNKFFFQIEYNKIENGKSVSYWSQNGFIYKTSCIPGNTYTSNKIIYNLSQSVLGTRHNVIENAKIDKVIENGKTAYVISGTILTKNEDPNAVVDLEYKLNGASWSWIKAENLEYNIVPAVKTTNLYYYNGFSKEKGVYGWDFSYKLQAKPKFIQFISINWSNNEVWLDKNRCLRYWIYVVNDQYPAFCTVYSTE